MRPRQILPWLLALFLAAQSQSEPQLSLQLNKDLVSWNWLGLLQFHIRPWGKNQLSFSNRFTSNLFRNTGEEQRWKDENRFELGWLVPLNQRIKVGTRIQSRIFSDENSFVQFSKHVLAAEAEWQPLPALRLKPATGLAVEEAYQVRDQGWYGRFGLQIHRLDMGGYLNYTDLQSVVRGFPGRRNQEHSFFTGWSTRFSEQASDSLRIGYQFAENRYYLPQRLGTEGQRSNALEQVVINARFLFNQLHYRFTPRHRLVIQTSFKNRDIDQTNPFLQNRRKEIVLENQVHYLFPVAGVNARMGLLFSQTSRDNPNLQTDIDALQSALSLALERRWPAGHRWWSTFSYTKYEYNTPDTVVNHDDRDEQRFILDAGYRRVFSPYFRLILTGQVYLYHQIFIHYTRSANNSWNRIFQLGAAFEHRPWSQVVHRNQIRILANYTVFDFDELFPQARSFLFRKLIYTDSLAIGLSPTLALNVLYQLEKEDNGTFFKQQFAQQVTKELVSHYVSISLQRKRLLGFVLSTGVTFFFRDEWNTIPTRRKVRQFRSITPRIVVDYPASKKMIFHAMYAPTRTSNFGSEIQRFTSGLLRMTYFF